MVIDIKFLSKLKQNERVEFLSRLNLIKTSSISNRINISILLVASIVLAASGRFLLGFIAWAISGLFLISGQSETSKKEAELGKEFFDFKIEAKTRK